MTGLWKYIGLVVAGCFYCSLILSQEKEEPAFVDNSILNQTHLTIRDIYVKGNKKTKKYIVEREVLFTQGQAYTISDILSNIRTSRQNLMNTSLFVDASVDFTNWTNDSMDIVVDVKERWYFFPVPYFRPIDRNWNVWINQYKVSFERVNYGVKFQGNNITGRNDKLNIFLINGYTRQVSANYYNPFADKKLVHGFGADVSYSQNREINYTTRRNQQAFFKDENKFIREQMYFGLSYSYRKGSIARHFVRLGYQIENVADTVLLLNPKFFSSGKSRSAFPELKYRFQYLNVDYIPYPTKGYTYEFDFLKRGFTKNMDLWQFRGRAAKHFTLPRKIYYSIMGELNLKLPFDQPFYNQPLLGYNDSYLRGLEYYVVDGVAGGFVRNTVRKELVSFKWKTGLRSRTYGQIPFKIFAKAYGDFGYVYNRNNVTGNILTNKFMYTGGFGIDVLTIYDIVLRIEYSFNQLNERALFFHKNDF
jgi:outer membrane protein assembly factor BamA